MLNNIVVSYSLDEKPDRLEYNEVVGITNLSYVTYQGESELAISLRKIVDMIPTGGLSQCPSNLILTQGKPFSNGEQPMFRCKGFGNIKKNITHQDIIYNEMCIVAIFKGLTPAIIGHDVFENQILRKVSYEDEQFLLSLYEHGNAPQQIEAYRFENFILDEIDGDDKTFMESAYKTERPTARWYNLQDGVDTERVLDIFSTIENFSINNFGFFRKIGTSSKKNPPKSPRLLRRRN